MRIKILASILLFIAVGCGPSGEGDALPDPGDLGESRAPLINAGGHTWADYMNVAQQLYVGYFGRPADTLGLDNMTMALCNANAPNTAPGLDAAYGSNATVRALVDSFGTSAESNALYTGDTSSFVTAIYRNLMNRAPDQAGLTFWTNAINSGGLSRSKAALSIMAGALTNTTPGLVDRTTVENKTTVAQNFTFQILYPSAEFNAYQGNIAAAQARNMLALVTNTTIPSVFQATVEATLNSIVANH